MPWNRAAALSGAVAAAWLASGAPSSARPAPCASPLLASWPTPGRDGPSRALARGGALEPLSQGLRSRLRAVGGNVES